MRVRFLSSSLLSLAILAACGSTAAPAPAPPQSSPPATAAASVAPDSQLGSAPAPSRSAAASTAPAAPLPTQLLIPAIHVDAPIERVGTTADGAMDVPKEWDDVGWFDRGYRPGQPGSAVMAGHLDSATDKAIFWDLNKLKEGDQVLVKREDGSQLTFSVTGSEIYPFDQAPIQKIFGPSDIPILNLVTCNGTFDRGAKNYDKRLVVYTRLVS